MHGDANKNADLAIRSNNIPSRRGTWNDLEFAKRVGSVIKRHREKHGLTQRDVARSLNVSRTTVTRAEMGEGNLLFPTALKLFKELDIPVSEAQALID